MDLVKVLYISLDLDIAWFCLKHRFDYCRLPCSLDMDVTWYLSVGYSWISRCFRLNLCYGCKSCIIFILKVMDLDRAFIKSLVKAWIWM